MKRYENQVETLKEKLSKRDSYLEELKKSQQIQKKIEESYEAKELLYMFEENPVVEEVKQAQI